MENVYPNLDPWDSLIGYGGVSLVFFGALEVWYCMVCATYCNTKLCAVTTHFHMPHWLRMFKWI